MKKQNWIVAMAVLVSLTGMCFYHSAGLIVLSCTTVLTLLIFSTAPELPVKTAVIRRIRPLLQNAATNN